ncbi:MAG TPA: tetratricopeptide repeat protein, partial [Aestuariivirga sp.]|nr:tetratricopeptide repeat protein [Aestuariivirga sp.]
GVLVFRGEGVEKDEKIGAEWMLVAARRGNPVAQNRVARLYAFGRGVAADPVEALKWNLLAAKGGRPDAELDTLLAKLTAGQKAEAEARATAFKPKPEKTGG